MSGIIGAAAGGASKAVGNVIGGAQNLYLAKKARTQANKAASTMELEGQAAAGRIRGRARRLAATQRASFASAGVDISGSATDVQYDSAIQYEVDAMSEIYKSNAAAANIRTQGEAGVTQTGMTNVGMLFGGNNSQGGSSGASSIAGSISNYYATKNNPTFGSN